MNEGPGGTGGGQAVVGGEVVGGGGNTKPQGTVIVSQDPDIGRLTLDAGGQGHRLIHLFSRKTQVLDNVDVYRQNPVGHGLAVVVGFPVVQQEQGGSGGCGGADVGGFDERHPVTRLSPQAFGVPLGVAHPHPPIDVQLPLTNCHANPPPPAATPMNSQYPAHGGIGGSVVNGGSGSS